MVCTSVCFVCVVALRKESVDRNHVGNSAATLPSMSLSARRAWIEIIMFVNLRVLDGSLSARRAWIEIRTPHQRNTKPIPSLSARRAWIEISSAKQAAYFFWSLSARRAWIEILRQMYHIT